MGEFEANYHNSLNLAQVADSLFFHFQKKIPRKNILAWIRAGRRASLAKKGPRLERKFIYEPPKSGKQKLFELLSKHPVTKPVNLDSLHFGVSLRTLASYISEFNIQNGKSIRFVSSHPKFRPKVSNVQMLQKLNKNPKAMQSVRTWRPRKIRKPV